MASCLSGRKAVSTALENPRISGSFVGKARRSLRFRIHVDRGARPENELAEARSTLATIREDIEHCISVTNSPTHARSFVDAAGLRLSQHLGGEL